MSIRRTLLVLPSIALLAACQLKPMQSLIGVSNVTPSEVDFGDRIEVTGNGFPEGRQATLSFLGTLYRPGRPAIEDVEIVTVARSASHERLVVTVSEALQAEFCGRGREADHTTFRGEVVAAFSPRNAAAPPIAGILRDVALDVHAPVLAPTVAEQREAEAKRLLEIVGLRVERSEGGLRVVALSGQSRAAAAGLLADDVIVSADGVNVRAETDLVPSGRHRHLRLLVRRRLLPEPLSVALDVQGLRSTPPGELARAALLVGIAALVVILCGGPLPKLVVWAARIVATRLRAHTRGADHSQPATSFARAVTALAEPVTPPAGSPWLLRLLPHASFLAVCTALATLAFGQHWILPSLDLVILWLMAATALAVASLIHGGWQATTRWSLRRGLLSALRVLGQALCGAALLSCAVFATGTASLLEIARFQGGAPWRWNAFRSPLLLIACCLLVLCAVPHDAKANQELPEAQALTTPRGLMTHAVSRSLCFAAEFQAALVAAGLAAVVFLGGHRVPGISLAEQSQSLGLSLLGAGLLLIKTWLVFAIVLAARWALPSLGMVQASGVLLRLVLPLAVVLPIATLGWELGVDALALRSIEAGIGVVLIVICLWLLVYFVSRTRACLRGDVSQLHVNPWL